VGLRSLLSLSFLGQTYIYLFDGRIWTRWVIAIVIVPIAILANAGSHRCQVASWANIGQVGLHGLMHEFDGLGCFRGGVPYYYDISSGGDSTF